jgi:hypothetical protein
VVVLAPLQKQLLGLMNARWMSVHEANDIPTTAHEMGISMRIS